MSPTTSLTPFPRYKRDKYTRFAHLFPRDADLWNRYLLTPDAQQYLAFDYDIKVGHYAIAAIRNPSPETNLQAGTLAKRIDALGFLTPELVDIIEVKPDQPHLASGQLLAYKALFTLTYPHIGVRALRLITASQDLELIKLVRAQGIDVYLVA